MANSKLGQTSFEYNPNYKEEREFYLYEDTEFESDPNRNIHIRGKLLKLLEVQCCIQLGKENELDNFLILGLGDSENSTRHMIFSFLSNKPFVLFKYETIDREYCEELNFWNFHPGFLEYVKFYDKNMMTLMLNVE